MIPKLNVNLKKKSFIIGDKGYIIKKNIIDSFLMLIINEYDKLITDMNIGKKILLGIKLKPVAPVK